jgi:uncharacterized protein YjiS (DUF1127 family)
MPAITAARTLPVRARLTPPLGRWLIALVQVVAREWRLRRDLAGLQSLDAAALRDIGLDRGSLEQAVRFGRDRSAPPACSAPRPTALPLSLTEWR